MSAPAAAALLVAALAVLSARPVIPEDSAGWPAGAAATTAAPWEDDGRAAATKVTFRVFQTLPVEPSEMTPAELSRMHRTVRATQAMLFSSPRRQDLADGGGIVRPPQQDDGVELALDVYAPSERRDYLVKRGEHCHPRQGNGNNPLNPQDEDASLQWYDVLSRYDSLMASASVNGGSSDADFPSRTASPPAAALERMAVELFKFCVLYNGDGHAFWGWEEQLLLPFRDVVSFDGNYGVVSVDSVDRVGHSTVKTFDADDSVHNGASSAAGNAAVNSGGRYVHDSFLSISPYSPARSDLSSMIRLLLETPDEVLADTPLLLPRALHRLISAKEGDVNGIDGMGSVDGSEKVEVKNNDGGAWTLLRNSCIPVADPANVGPSSLTPNSPSGVESQIVGSVVDASPSSALSGLGESFPSLNARRTAARCPLSEGGYCCLIFLPAISGNMEASNKNAKDGGLQTLPVMALRHPVGGWASPKGRGDTEQMPYMMHHVESNDAAATAKPLKLGGLPETDLPFISTVRLVKHYALDTPASPSTTRFPTHPADTPNFFDILFENDCLPYRKECHRCLKDISNEAPLKLESDGDKLGGATVPHQKSNACSKCRLECPCYCDVLCKVRPPPKPVARTYTIRPPRHRKEPNRLVPKVIHQTWFEPVTREGYPNMSRLIESWKKSGWEYYFYDDDAAGEFLGAHFPPEVREAYESIIPGAFKADLFRYCVLIIRGGVYADMDVLLETNLDHAIANDIGFMTPIDEPGREVGHRSCLWNGLIASAPGHPFLAHTIEIVVNNIRNRFTAVDYDDMLCPNPILSVSHTVDTLFTCGPCVLGAGINNLLGRHMQAEFEVGDVDIWRGDRTRPDNGAAVHPTDPRFLIPGRTIILAQDKNDMGAHRFTWTDRNLIVAATDMPDYDDRPSTKEHYSKTHEKAGVYGMRKLYTDTRRANEEIRFVVGRP